MDFGPLKIIYFYFWSNLMGGVTHFYNLELAITNFELLFRYDKLMYKGSTKKIYN